MRVLELAQRRARDQSPLAMGEHVDRRALRDGPGHLDQKLGQPVAHNGQVPDGVAGAVLVDRQRLKRGCEVGCGRNPAAGVGEAHHVRWLIAEGRGVDVGDGRRFG